MSKAWLFNDVSSNLFKQTYAKDFMDVSGDMYIRNGSLIATGDVSMNGNISCNSISLTTPFSSSGINVDVQSALDGKQNIVTAGTNVSLSGTTINATFGAGGSMSTLSNTNETDVGPLQTISDSGASRVLFGFGTAISNDGNVVAASAPLMNVSGVTRAGHVQVYHYVGGNLVARGAVIESPMNVVGTQYFGYSVSLNGDGSVLAISSPFAGYNSGGYPNTGIVDIFSWDGSTWSPKGTFIGWDGLQPYPNYSMVNSYTGVNIKLSTNGNTLAINSTRFEADVYDFIGSAWVKRGNTLSTGASIANYTTAWKTLAMSGDGNRVAISWAAYNSYKGKVLIFEWSNNLWNNIGTLTTSIAEARYGASIDLSEDGTTIVIGAHGTSSYSGQVEVKTYNGDGTWSDKGNVISSTISQDQFGIQSAINGDGTRIMVGAKKNPIGYAEYYKYNSTTNIWDLHISRITGSVDYDYMGTKVGISGDGMRIVVAAPESSFSTTTNSVNYSGSGRVVTLTIQEGMRMNVNSSLIVAKNLSVSGSISVNGASVHASDDRLKVDEMPIENALETLDKLKPTIYVKNNQTETGLIVQDIWYNNPELRHLVHVSNGETILDVSGEYNYDTDLTKLNWNADTASLNYTGLISYIVKGIQELDDLLITNKANIEKL